jgi:hypothetical protein
MEIQVSGWQLKTPVVLFVFNRPYTTEKIMDIIRKAAPPKLFVIADGPSTAYHKDVHECREVRRIIETVDWRCEVFKNYSDTNIGCDTIIPMGLDWVFDKVDDAIIFEDDCLPHMTFFRYCEEMLDQYRDDKRIMTICGSNFQFGRRRNQYSYYFSRYHLITGWATWRRAWKHYDHTMELWPEIRNGGWLNDFLVDKKVVSNVTMLLDKYYEEQIKPWDVLWYFSCWMQGALAAIPNVNLIKNIGYGREATHTRDEKSIFANIFCNPMNFPLLHPSFIIRDAVADTYSDNTMLLPPSLSARIKSKFKCLLSKEKLGKEEFETSKFPECETD